MLEFMDMRNVNKMSLLILLLAVPGLLQAQAPAKKPAAKPAAKKAAPAAKPAEPPAAAAAQAKQEAPADPFDTAMTGLGSNDAAVRRRSTEMLGQLRNQKAAPALVKALKDPAQPVRYAALHTLGVMNYAPAEKEILAMLSSEDKSLRRGSIAALGQMQSKAAGEGIAAQLGDPDQYVRIEAIKAVGNIGYAPAAPQLVKLLDKAEQPPVRVEAALALSKLGMPDGLLTAYEFIKSPEISMRSQSMNVIAAVGDARSLQFIQELYNTETDPATKSMLDFTVQRLKTRLAQK